MVVEGDDCLLRVDGLLPSAEDFAALGLIIKIEIHDTINTASFCGQVFDEDELAIITDPKELLVNFGWTTGRYARASDSVHQSLARAKALSYLHQYPSCPIVAKAAEAVCRITRGISIDRILEDPHYSNMYEREELLAASKLRAYTAQPSGPKTRILVEQLYGIDIPTQLRYEEYFDGLSAFEPIPAWFESTKDQEHYNDHYVAQVDVNETLVEYPPEIHQRLAVKFPRQVSSARYGKFTVLHAPERGDVKHRI